jgi:4-hydroxy-tetrahydrodipicolinate reductase
MTPLRIVIIGHGKMGKAIAALAQQRGHQVHIVVGRLENPGGKALTVERLRGADVAVEFTRPDAVVANLERLIELGIPTVTGTTGWAEELPRIQAMVQQRGGALLHAASFSVGVHLFFRAARALAECFRDRAEFAVSIHEEHHASKLDAPSGTALLLQRQLWAVEPSRRFPITSIRAGESPGSHTLTYDAPHETVTLRHVSRSREVFAVGALAAAEWLPGHQGTFTFEDMLFEGRV